MKTSTVASAFGAATMVGGSALRWPSAGPVATASLISDHPCPGKEALFDRSPSHRAGYPRSNSDSANVFVRSADASHRAGHPRDIDREASDANTFARSADASHRAGHPRAETSADTTQQDCGHASEHGFALGGVMHVLSFGGYHAGDNATMDAADGVVNAFKSDDQSQIEGAFGTATSLLGDNDSNTLSKYAKATVDQAQHLWGSEEGTKCRDEFRRGVLDANGL